MFNQTRFNKSFLAAIFILMVLHLVFFLFAVRSESYLIKDSYEYLHQAENIMSGIGWYAGDIRDEYEPHLESRRPPLYGFFISLIQVIFNKNIFILIVQILLSLINFAGLAYLLTRFKFGKKISWYLLLPFLLFPSQFIFSNMIMAEILFQSCVFWSFFFMILFLKEKDGRLLILHPVFVSLAILTKPVLYLFWIPEILWFIYLLFRKKIYINHLLFSILPLIAILVISFYNQNKTGYFHYSSMRATNLLAYNTYQTLRLDHTEEEAKNILDSIHHHAVATSEDFAGLSRALEKSGIEIIKNNPVKYILLHAKGVIKFFIDTGRHDMYTFFVKDFEGSEYGITYYFKNEGLKGVLNYLNQFSLLFIFYSGLIFLINIFLVVSLIAFIFNKNISTEIRIYTIMVIFFLAIITGPIGSSRFKVAVYPEILFTLPFFLECIKNSHFYKKIKW